MTKIVISTTTLALSLFAAAATAANPPTAGLHDPAVANAGRQIRSSAIRAHMAFLADDLLEGRGTATRGYEIAAHYVASQLDAAGLEPGVNGAWFQRVPMRRGVLIDGGSSVEIIPAAGERSSLLPGRDILLRGGFQGLTQVEGRVVFVGYGVTAPERGYDDYAGVEAKGKIVAYFAGAPESFPPEERAHFGATPTKTANAAAHGA
ncbi:MAG TPA: hypothetical protein VN851_27885, partial [Thermoanaerobaculia bacterium]|nr:hypothetical protein [Thermoanaerobaculia bacterium]